MHKEASDFVAGAQPPLQSKPILLGSERKPSEIMVRISGQKDVFFNWSVAGKIVRKKKRNGCEGHKSAQKRLPRFTEREIFIHVRIKRGQIPGKKKKKEDIS